MKAPVSLVILAVALVAALICGPLIIDRVDATQYAVKQAAITGEMSVKVTPGWMFQNFGDITKYNRTDMLYFSDQQEDIDDLSQDEFVDPQIGVFTGNSTAKISAFIKVQLPTSEDNLIRLHRDWKSPEAVRMEMLRNAVSVAIKAVSPLFTPEEAFVDRRTEFAQLVREVLENGEFKTVTKESIVRDAFDTTLAPQKQKIVEIFLDSNGNRVITKPSILTSYGVSILQLDIKDFSWDAKTDELIKTKKEAEQKRIASRSEAEKAKQDAITAAAQAEANVAVERGKAEVVKIKAVTEAQQAFEVAELEARKAIEEAKKVKAQGEAEAYAAKLKVQAGLSPLERATIDKETAIGVASELAKIKMPDHLIVVGGDGKNGGTADPFTAIGLNSFYDLSKKMAQ
jgi:regulator of protease activity HflC (stomatin/prohibitin superfamily)